MDGAELLELLGGGTVNETAAVEAECEEMAWSMHLMLMVPPALNGAVAVGLVGLGAELWRVVGEHEAVYRATMGLVRAALHVTFPWRAVEAARELLHKKKPKARNSRSARSSPSRTGHSVKAKSQSRLSRQSRQSARPKPHSRHSS